MDENLFKILQKILGMYALLLIIVGTISSCMSFYICFKLSKISTFVFLAFLSVSDIVSLYYWNLTNFVDNWFDIDFLNSSYWLCKIGNYYQFTSLQISAWILIVISIDHNLSIRIKHWRKLYFTTNRAFICACLVVAFFLILNSSILVSFGHETIVNNTNKVICFYLSDYPSTKCK